MVANMMLLTNDLHKLVQFLIFPKGGGARIGAPPLRSPLGTTDLDVRYFFGLQ